MVVIDQNPFYYAAIGGIILGIATSLNYCLRGKVTGMSGMVYGIVFWHREDVPQKISIMGGMLVAAGIFFDIFRYGTFNNFTPFGPEYDITKGTSYIGYGLAGLLVGFGTKFSNGCTSGHGLCGIPRFSMRSIVAVCTFLTAALAIGTIRYHTTLGQLTNQQLNPQYDYEHLASANVCIVVGVLLPFIGGYLSSKNQNNHMEASEIVTDQILTFLTGLVFGIGLLVSGMVRRSNIIGFLGLGSDWNPSLMFVLGCGVVVNLITFNYMLRKKKKSILGNDLFNPQGGSVDWKLLLGATCFGLGWGIGGLCPGPAILQFAVFSIPVHIIWFGFLLIGMFIARKVEHYLADQGQVANNTKQKVEAESKVDVLPTMSPDNKLKVSPKKIQQISPQKQEGSDQNGQMSKQNFGVQIRQPGSLNTVPATETAAYGRDSQIRDSAAIVQPKESKFKSQKQVRGTNISTF